LSIGSLWEIRDGAGKVRIKSTIALDVADSVEGIAPYFKKSQTYDPPQKEHPNKQFMPIAAKDEYHGTNGPIHTSFNDYWEVKLHPRVRVAR
jgi:hypothetical protein